MHMSNLQSNRFLPNPYIVGYPIRDTKKIRLFGSCYAKLLATLTKEYYKMYQQISKSAVRVDI
jgi:hypothetical protein